MRVLRTRIIGRFMDRLRLYVLVSEYLKHAHSYTKKGGRIASEEDERIFTEWLNDDITLAQAGKRWGYTGDTYTGALCRMARVAKQLYGNKSKIDPTKRMPSTLQIHILKKFKSEEYMDGLLRSYGEARMRKRK